MSAATTRKARNVARSAADDDAESNAVSTPHTYLYVPPKPKSRRPRKRIRENRRGRERLTRLRPLTASSHCVLIVLKTAPSRSTTCLPASSSLPPVGYSRMYISYRAVCARPFVEPPAFWHARYFDRQRSPRGEFLRSVVSTSCPRRTRYIPRRVTQ